MLQKKGVHRTVPSENVVCYNTHHTHECLPFFPPYRSPHPDPHHTHILHRTMKQTHTYCIQISHVNPLFATPRVHTHSNNKDLLHQIIDPSRHKQAHPPPSLLVQLPLQEKKHKVIGDRVQARQKLTNKNKKRVALTAAKVLSRPPCPMI